MNVVEKEALSFFNYDLYKGNNTLNSIKSSIDLKLYDFNRNRDKLDFLKILYRKTIEAKEKHGENCNCSFDQSRNIGLFAIEQEIENVNSFYTFIPKSENAFSVEEESKLHTKLNDIIENLNKLGLGQEIIYDEIDELKYHFNLGKNNWFQLLKGKLFDIGLAYGIEKLILEDIYTDLSKEVENVLPVFLNK